MQREWTNETIAYSRDAERVGGAYRALAEKIAARLPQNARVCDACCGAGELSLALAARGMAVTAVDASAFAVESLQKRAGNALTALCGEIEALASKEKYDAMVFCAFPYAQRALAIAKAQCAGKVFLVTHDLSDGRFSPGEAWAGRCSAARVETLLRSRGIRFESERFALDFTQPFRSIFAAERFFSIYARGQEIFRPHEIRERLVRCEGEFPYCLRQQRKLRLFVFAAKDL